MYFLNSAMIDDRKLCFLTFRSLNCIKLSLETEASLFSFSITYRQFLKLTRT